MFCPGRGLLEPWQGKKKVASFMQSDYDFLGLCGIQEKG
jgi:hypothetical protein